MAASTGGAPYQPAAPRNPWQPVPIGRPRPQRTTLGPRPVRGRRQRQQNRPRQQVSRTVYEQWAANPATRPKVPDDILKRINPEAYQQRVRNRQMRQPVVPGASITNRDLERETSAAVGLEFGPLEEQLRREYARSQAVQQRIPEWFNYYRQQVQGLGLADAAAAQYAKDEITNLGGALANAAAQAAAQDQAAMQADAAIRGATVDDAALQRALQASAVNTADLGTLAALQVQLGKNSGDFWRGQENVSEMGKIEQLLKEEGVRRGLDESARELAREKGQYATKYRADRIDREQQRTLERAAFGLKEAEAAAGAAAAQQKTRQQRRQQRLDFISKHGVPPGQYARMTPQERARNDRWWRQASNPPKQGDGDKINKWGFSNRDWQRMTPEERFDAIRRFNEATKPRVPSDRESRLTREQFQRYRGQISQASDLFLHPPRVDKTIGQALNLDPSRAGTRLTPAEVVEWIRTGKSPLGRNVPPEIVNAGRSLASNQGRGLGPWGRQNARRIGGRRLARQFPRVKPNRNRQAGAGAFTGTTASGRVGG